VTLARLAERDGDYLKSVGYLEEAIRRLEGAGAGQDDDVKFLHSRLVDDYNELAQQRHFSSEICLRILYHLEQAWPFLEKHVSVEEPRKNIQFARKTVGHYELAESGIRVIEGAPDREFSRLRGELLGEEGPSELVLPPDGIEESAKLLAKDAILARIRAFDEAQPSEYALEPSDRSLEEVFEVLDAAFRQISNVHYRKYLAQQGAEELVQEVWYEYPETLKVHYSSAGGLEGMMIRDGQVVWFDPAQRTIVSEERLEDEPGWLMDLRRPNAKHLQHGYDWTVHKLAAPPAFLNPLYEGEPAAALYLLTGNSKTAPMMLGGRR
jgi:hypothetical protein